MLIRKIVFLFCLCFTVGVIAMDKEKAEDISVNGKVPVHSTSIKVGIRPYKNDLEMIESLGDLAPLNDIMLQVLSYLTLQELDQVVPLVSRAFYHISEDSILWTPALGEAKLDYDSQRVTRPQYRLHHLKVLVNSLSNDERKLEIMKKYNLQPSEENCMQRLRDGLHLYPIQTASFLEHLILQQCHQNLCNKLGIVGPIERRISNCDPSVEKLEGSPLAFIDYWVEQGSLEAMQLKITKYKTDDSAVLLLNDKLIEAGNEEAINRKIEGCYGLSPFKIMESEACDLNEILVKRGNSKALNRRARAHFGGWFGYPCDLGRAFDLNLELALEGDPDAIRTRVWSIASGRCEGLELFPPSPEAAVAFNESLVIKKDPTAISIKCQELENGGCIVGGYGYTQNSLQLVAFNEELKREGISIAFLNEIKWRAAGLHGYPKDPEAAFALRKNFLEGEHSQACKVEAILFPTSEEGIIRKTKELIEAFEDKLRFVRHLKAYGLKHGMFGFFENDDAAAHKYITDHKIAF